MQPGARQALSDVVPKVGPEVQNTTTKYNARANRRTQWHSFQSETRRNDSLTKIVAEQMNAPCPSL